jgi:hypothetical protein
MKAGRRRDKTQDYDRKHYLRKLLDSLAKHVRSLSSEEPHCKSTTAAAPLSLQKFM